MRRANTDIPPKKPVTEQRNKLLIRYDAAGSGHTVTLQMCTRL